MIVRYHSLPFVGSLFEKKRIRIRGKELLHLLLEEINK